MNGVPLNDAGDFIEQAQRPGFSLAELECSVADQKDVVEILVARNSSGRNRTLSVFMEPPFVNGAMFHLGDAI
jgi:hypothetical protein